IRCNNDLEIQMLMDACAEGKKAPREPEVDSPQGSRRGDLIWVSFRQAATDAMLRSFSLVARSRRMLRQSSFFSLAPCRVESLPALTNFFKRTVGTFPSYQSLPHEELLEVLAMPDEMARDLIIGGSVDQAAGVLTLARGDGSPIVVPLSAFKPS